MRILLSVLLVLLVCAGQGKANEFRLPADKPVVRLTVSEDWKPETTPQGLTAQTQDGKASLTVSLASSTQEMDSVIDASDAMLKARKVRLDRSSRRENKFKIGNFPSEEIVYTGFDGKGPVVVSFTFVTVGSATLVFTYHATGEGNLEHQNELGQIFDSIKTIKAPAVP